MLDAIFTLNISKAMFAGRESLQEKYSVWSERGTLHTITQPASADLVPSCTTRLVEELRNSSVS